MGKRVLVADNDIETANLMKLYLEKDGYQVFTAGDGWRAIQAVRDMNPDLVVLDLMMPEMDGQEVCRALRAESEVPIIGLTATATESEPIAGLDPGADDYVAKPASPSKVVARVRRLLRRVAQEEAERGPQSIRLGSLLVDFRRHQAKAGEELVSLTPTEFRLLKVLATEPGQVYSRSELVEQVLGAGYEGFERGIDSHVRNLRRKVEPDPSRPRYVVTVFGVGYRLDGTEP
jgi:two-component system, OmpR family, alkaline phosphatase synthesis response regulator PhoP